MTIPLKSIAVGKCYLTDTGHVRRVLRLTPIGRIQFEVRAGHVMPKIWRIGIQDGRSFASQAEREVPCDWTPEMGEAKR